MEINEKLQAVFNEFRPISLPRWDELPDIELYMDQVMALMEKYVGNSADEKLLTPAMVNNYVKMGIMPPPVKKRYSRVHLVHLIIICILKQVMPISIIRDLIKTSLSALPEEELLNLFGDYYSNAANEAVKNLEKRVEGVEHEDATELNMLAAFCAVRAQIELRIAERLACDNAEEKSE